MSRRVNKISRCLTRTTEAAALLAPWGAVSNEINARGPSGGMIHPKQEASSWLRHADNRITHLFLNAPVPAERQLSVGAGAN